MLTVKGKTEGVLKPCVQDTGSLFPDTLNNLEGILQEENCNLHFAIIDFSLLCRTCKQISSNSLGFRNRYWRIGRARKIDCITSC